MATTNAGYAILPADNDDVNHHGYQPMNDNGTVLPVAPYHPQSDSYIHNNHAANEAPPSSVASFYPPLGYMPPSTSGVNGNAAAGAVPQTSIYIPPPASSSSATSSTNAPSRGSIDGGRNTNGAAGRNSLVGVPLHRGGNESKRFIAGKDCKDILWAVLFILHLLVIFGMWAYH
jgi:hypothetical protein